MKQTRILLLLSIVTTIKLLSCRSQDTCLTIDKIDSLQMGKLRVDPENHLYFGYYDDGSIRYIAVDNIHTSYKVFVALDFHDSIIGIDELYKNRKVEFSLDSFPVVVH